MQIKNGNREHAFWFNINQGFWVAEFHEIQTKGFSLMITWHYVKIFFLFPHAASHPCWFVLQNWLMIAGLNLLDASQEKLNLVL